MATIQHSALPNSELHEPKHILTSTTADAGKVITPSSVTSGTSQLRLLTLDDLSDSGVTSWTGWGQYSDSAYTSGFPLPVDSGVRTKVTIDGLGSQTNTDGLPTGVTDLWNTSTNKIIPAGVNDAYQVRLTFKQQLVVGAADKYTDIELDIGGAPGVIYDDTKLFIKGTSPLSVTVSFPVYTGTTFNTNGGEFYITPSADAEFYDFQVSIFRIHKGA